MPPPIQRLMAAGARGLSAKKARKNRSALKGMATAKRKLSHNMALLCRVSAKKEKRYQKKRMKLKKAKVR